MGAVIGILPFFCVFHRYVGRIAAAYHGEAGWVYSTWQYPGNGKSFLSITVGTVHLSVRPSCNLTR